MSVEKPAPIINPDNRPFWEACRRHRLTFQKCAACGHMRWPAAYLCPECLSADCAWVPVPGTGTVFSFAIYHAAHHPAFLADIPYVVALVNLDGGPRFLSGITGCRPGEVFCGMPVEADWEERPSGVTVPVFRPRAA